MSSFGSLIAFLTPLVASTAAAAAASPEFRDDACNYPGWYYYEGSCYLIDPIGTGEMDWQAAADFCPTANPNFPGAYLAEIMDREEQEFVYYIVRMLAAWGYEFDYWLGGNDLVHEGEWIWEHSGVPANYTAWWPGEPNDADGGEDCLFFYFGYAPDYGTWFDAGCDFTANMRPMCKAPFKPHHHRASL